MKYVVKGVLPVVRRELLPDEKPGASNWSQPWADFHTYHRGILYDTPQEAGKVVAELQPLMPKWFLFVTIAEED